MSTFPCVLQCGGMCCENTDAVRNLATWDNLKAKALLWRGLDKFGDIYATVDWDNGTGRHGVHKACKMTLWNGKKLDQAKIRQKKRELELEVSPSQSSSVSDSLIQPAIPPAKRLRSTDEGPIHDKTKCVWCCKPESVKNPQAKLSLIAYDYAWAAFKRHTVALEDEKMRDRINSLIACASDDPYAVEIRYHNKCWIKYVRSYMKYENMKYLILFKYEN